MELLPQEEVEGYQLDGFMSEDRQHAVRWHRPESKPYPQWWCVTHDTGYYTDCALQEDLPKKDS